MTELDRKLAERAIAQAAEAAGIKDVVAAGLADKSSVVVAADGCVTGADESIAALRARKPHLFWPDWSALTDAQFDVEENAMRKRLAASVTREERIRLPEIDASTLNSEHFSMLDRYARGHASASDISTLAAIAKSQGK